MTVTDTIWKAAKKKSKGLVPSNMYGDKNEKADLWSRTEKVWVMWGQARSPCVPVLIMKDSGYQVQIRIPGAAKGMSPNPHIWALTLCPSSLSRSLTLVRVLPDWGGASLAGCLRLDYKVPAAFFVWLLPACLPGTFFFFTLKRKLIPSFQPAS